MGMRLGALYRNSTVVEYGSLDNERLILFDKGSMKQYDFLTILTLRPGLYTYGKIRLTASGKHISDSLYHSTLPDEVAAFLPEGKQDIYYMNLYIEYAYDSRNHRAYPLKGNYLKGFVDKRGLGIPSHDVDYFYYGIDMHFYQQISDRWYTAEMIS
jgi:outer membrane protein assembly factor BamA